MHLLNDRYRPRHLSLALVSSIVRDFVTWVDALVNETDEESQVVPTRHRRSACAYFLIFLSTRCVSAAVLPGTSLCAIVRNTDNV